jgi:hypothetical protein
MLLLLVLLRYDLLPDGFMRQAPARASGGSRRRARAAAARRAATTPVLLLLLLLLLLLHGRVQGVGRRRGGRRLAPAILLLLLAVLRQAEHRAHHELIVLWLSAQHGQVEQIVRQRVVVYACTCNIGWKNKHLATALIPREVKAAHARQGSRGEQGPGTPGWRVAPSALAAKACSSSG